ncbi:uncharacterized protein LOC143284597 [Babylonia areolata]|uniref:uncharacterized protein LOC143284597 n=1 Tax=Babylonia areolata TaxID=304850 RepID=UPI003FD3BF96
MATTQALQNLLDEFRKVTEQLKSTQSSVQHLRGVKKEADIARRRQEVLGALKAMQDTAGKLQEQMKTNQKDLEKALGQADPQEQDSRQTEKQATAKGPGFIESRKLSPEQQEVLYELKASRMGAMRAQNEALRHEVLLTQRRKHLLDARHAQTQSYSGSETLRAAHALEAKVRGANLKIKALEDELRKSQQMALHYREMYEDGQRRSETENAAKSQRASTKEHQGLRAKTAPVPKPKPAPLKEQSFVGPNTNVNDVVRKNECLLEENEIQRREIQRLKQDNADLVLMAKTATTDRDTVFARLGTSESARQDLHKRYQRLKNENTQLSRSFTRQAAVWVEAKKQQQQFETLDRWGEIYPVAPHGGKERYFAHGQKENTSLPRQMYPVENYGGTSTV